MPKLQPLPFPLRDPKRLPVRISIFLQKLIFLIPRYILDLFRTKKENLKWSLLSRKGLDTIWRKKRKQILWELFQPMPLFPPYGELIMKSAQPVSDARLILINWFCMFGQMEQLVRRTL